MDSVQAAVVVAFFILAISIIIFVVMPRIEKRRRSREAMKRVAEEHSQQEDAVASYNSAWRYLESKPAPVSDTFRATPRSFLKEDDYNPSLPTAIVLGELSSQQESTADSSPAQDSGVDSSS